MSALRIALRIARHFIGAPRSIAKPADRGPGIPGAPLLELRGISKRFGAVQALSDVRFDVSPEEIVALVGDNGAGKSTLIKVISGIHRADSGVIRWQGKEVVLGSPNDAGALGIATVYQDLALCDNLDVVANLFLGHELTTRGGPLGPLGARGPLGVMDEVAMERKAVELLARLDVKLPDVRVRVAQLSGGQRQSIAVARAVLAKPRVMLLDEPTAALGVAQTAQVLELVRRLKAEQLGVVIISHNLADVFQVADRIVVLRLGRRAAAFETRATTREAVVAAITGATA